MEEPHAPPPSLSQPSGALQPALRSIRDFMRSEIIPRELEHVTRDFFEIEPELLRLRYAVKSQGLWAPQVPRELGGMGLSLLDHAHVSEALGHSPFGHYIFGCQAPDAGNLEVLHSHGTPEQKERYLTPLASGEIRSCFAMTEPGRPGSNPTELDCRAIKDGEDYVIDGRKWFTSSADGAAFAIVMAVTNPDAAPHKRASQIIVPSDTAGFRRLRNIPVMGHTGEGWPSHAEVVFESCRVPQTNRLGPEGAGFLIAQERLGPGRIHHCMRWIGISERAFEMMCSRAQARVIEGEPLGRRAIVQAWIAECRARISAARLLVLDAAWRIDQLGFAQAQEEISLIKFFVADVMLDVLDHAIQVHGALGISGDTILGYWYAQERAARIYDGPDEVHKLAAARRILKRYK